ncbi:hypothetical protein LIER_43540 [Lithospermum erythrorhizon]|uniref:Mediator of RNA polymerase II transcription subunit 7 n=1 Tax=Lithospermum erythrorhizon TaxID=34254 RepID=A0AAV3QDW0_LITER
MNLPHEPPSPSLAGQRHSDMVVLQGKEKQARAASELSDPPKSDIPPPPLPDYDPLMAAGFFTPESLTLPYTLPWGQQICEGTPFTSNLQYFHAMGPFLLEGLCRGYSNTPDPLEVYRYMCRHLIQVINAGLELVRRVDCLGEENKDLLSQGPFGKIVELEEELAKVKKELAEGQ